MNQLTQIVLEKLCTQMFPYISGRKNSLPTSHYIGIFGYVLKTGIAWRDLVAPLHWTTYYKKFMKWVKAGLFKLLHDEMLCLALQHKLISKKDLNTLFIDSTMIKNFKGTDLLGKNHYDRNRSGNKVAIIVSSKGIPLSLNLTTANKNDQKQVISAIDDITFTTIKKFTLVADGAYVSDPLKSFLHERQIKFIYPYKKNQKDKNTAKEIALLKKRYIVENTFSWIQNYRRIRVRYDKLSKTYEQFYYFSLASVVALKLYKLFK